MAPANQEGKKSVRYRQFSGGYAKVCEIEIRALLEGYRQGLVRRNEVRVFAARLIVIYDGRSEVIKYL